VLKGGRGASRIAPADGMKRPRWQRGRGRRRRQARGRSGRCRRRDGGARDNHAAKRLDATWTSEQGAGGSRDERATGAGARVDATGDGRTRSGEQRPGSTPQKKAGGEATAMGTGRRGGSFGSGHEHSRHSPYMPGGWPGRGRRGEAGSALSAPRGRREREIRPAALAELAASPWSQEPSFFGVEKTSQLWKF
jgi:hypothetical protein